jgi:hypothetical protein
MDKNQTETSKTNKTALTTEQLDRVSGGMGDAMATAQAMMAQAQSYGVGLKFRK